MTSTTWKGSYDSDWKYKSKDDYRMGTEICQWVSMETVAPLYTKYETHENSEKNQ